MPRHVTSSPHAANPYATDLHGSIARQRQDQLRAEADADRLARSARSAGSAGSAGSGGSARRRFRLFRLRGRAADAVKEPAPRTEGSGAAEPGRNCRAPVSR
ncbi:MULTISPECIES: hypothetical protein [Pseudonocardia]|uniref:Uncharacterized protein n=2 Tax=Pseudonocardia TaxID=1847 RepID=A0A1Y2N0I0_PSEAH|nr:MULTISPECIES: hypothetical protein [Pseudonocardia]OSY40932.1 hypothetical protein BG845_02271 [Pseudonocardia autotrophica]TDN73938.1 hypothetical protein C8E95_3050 [Pseudonocardia autotrophica]BBG04691.1 hypothetical protein Pdca_59000 [Pseudonocardia autotrophica]